MALGVQCAWLCVCLCVCARKDFLQFAKSQANLKPASLSLSICNYISLAFDCFANLELFAALQMLSKCLIVSVCLCLCVCLCACLPFSYMFWIDLIWLIRFVFLCQSTPNYWPFGTLTLLFHSKTNQRRSSASVWVCVGVCVCAVVCLWFVFGFFFRICEKFLKLLQVNIFLCPSQLFAECSLNWQLLCGIAFFARIRFFFDFATHTNWIINTPTFCIFPMWNSFPKSNTNAARATATEKFN